jgi:hypothetical protein
MLSILHISVSDRDALRFMNLGLQILLLSGNRNTRFTIHPQLVASGHRPKVIKANETVASICLLDYIQCCHSIDRANLVTRLNGFLHKFYTVESFKTAFRSSVLLYVSEESSQAIEISSIEQTMP